MRKTLKYAAIALGLLIGIGMVLGVKGYFDAIADSHALGVRADALIAAGRGPAGLGRGRLEQLMMVEDPGFLRHDGVDISTPGAGLTTITQSLAKRVGFKNFRPGIQKIRQTGYAMGLERELTKAQIVTLLLDEAEMGRGPKGWMTGFFATSLTVYGRPVVQLDNRRFLTLVAVMIAPAKFDLRRPDPALQDRVDRINRLVSGKCHPQGERDVWLKGCVQA